MSQTPPKASFSPTLAIHGGDPVRSRPFPAWPIYGESERRYLIQALESGKWGKLDGPLNAEFERRFSAYVGAQYGLTVVNGSVSLRLALWAAGIEAGDEVIVPPYTFIATATAVLEANGIPVFVDIDEATCNLNPDLIEAAITPRTKAIIPVHFAGLCADMDRIHAIARKHGLTVIEDAAHAHGAEWKGKKAGSLGDMGSFSFQSSKNLTSGEGGIITTSNTKLAERCRSLHSCGRVEGGAWYEHQILGGNYRLGEFQAAVLLAQLERLEKQTKMRDAHGLFLNQELSKIEGIVPLKRGGGETLHAYHLYLFRYLPKHFGGCSKEQFVKALQAEGIPCSGGYYLPIYKQPYFLKGDFGPYQKPTRDRYAKVECPTCERACRDEVIWIGQNALLGNHEDMLDIVRAIQKICKAV